MRNFFRFPAITAAFILITTILLLPNVGAARRALRPSSTSTSAINSRAAANPFNSLPQEDGEEVFADLSVTKAVDSDQATPGQNLTYTIRVHNAETFSVANVTLNDPLPEGLVFVSLAKPGNWTCTTPQAGDNGTVNCTTQSLDAGANDVFTLVASISPEASPGSSYTNIATVSSTIPDSNEENNSAPATTTVQSNQADLTVTKSADTEDVAPGQNVTYTITVYNSGSSTADNATLNDVLPADLTFVSLSKPASWSCTTPAVGAGGSIDCTNPSLPNKSADVFTLVASVPEKAQAETSYTNTAIVGSGTSDPNEENNSASAAFAVSSADLELIKVDTPDPVSSGANLTYTITLQNNGPNAADNVSLEDTLPAGTTFASLSKPNGWLCTTPGVGGVGKITCTADSMTGSALFTLVVKVDPNVSPGTILTNTANVTSSTTDLISGNNSATATTKIVNLRGWTTAGDSSVTEDESNPARPVYTNFTAAVSPGSPVGTYTLRYNIQAMDGLAGAGANTRLKVRFRDEGEGSRVLVAIMRSPISGGVATVGTLFDSDAYTPVNGFQSQEILMPAVTFDFTQNVYWLEVIMIKSGTTNQPGFGSAQINRQ
jgi:uncharacterized repeat protein (TIGR01451 family)